MEKIKIITDSTSDIPLPIAEELGIDKDDILYVGNDYKTDTILTKDERSLNGMYAAFGRVIEGFEIVEKIYELEGSSKLESEDDSETGIKAFTEYPIIKKATVETFGVNYGFPKVNEAFDYNAYMQDLLTQYYTTNE